MFTFTLRQIEIFVTVAQAGTFAAAAQRLHMSVSALTAATTELEKAVGEELLIRRKARGVELTAAGRRFLPHAQDLLSQAEILSGAGDEEPISGQLVLGCYTPIASALIPEVITRLTQQYPQLSVNFTATDQHRLVDMLVSGEADIALMYQQFWPIELTSRPVSARRPYVLVPADHPWAARGTVTVQELSGENLIMMDVHPSRVHTLALFEGMNLPPKIRWVSQDFELTRALVGRGMGVAVLLQRHASDTTMDGHNVARVEVTPAPAPVAVHAVWRKRNRLPHQLQALIDVMKDAQGLGT
ncbi:LysR substrate-binding domain-containing protein [Micrococcoides hystricis]|uniref:LysR substrate-binding domain-containing protein n=1 Tax=Micrococcoides hystricis TaxID=1572761 RepID=A0ABV6PBX3_9MICC